MKAKELIQALQKYDADARVVIRGYESGYNDILEVKALQITANSSKGWYDGEYETAESDDAKTIVAIELWGENLSSEDD